MKNTDFTALVEVDATYGEISKETAAAAKKDGEAAGVLSVFAYVGATIGTSLGLALVLGGCTPSGAGTGVAGLFMLYAARVLAREAKKQELIHLAYTQRERLRELRGDNVLQLPEGSKRKKLKG